MKRAPNATWVVEKHVYPHNSAKKFVFTLTLSQTLIWTVFLQFLRIRFGPFSPKLEDFLERQGPRALRAFLLKGRNTGRHFQRIFTASKNIQTLFLVPHFWRRKNIVLFFCYIWEDGNEFVTQFSVFGQLIIICSQVVTFSTCKCLSDTFFSNKFI